MSKKKHAASVSHFEATIVELRTDRAFAVEYLKAAMEELNDSKRRAVGLLALRNVAEAYGGIALIARKPALLVRLYRALSPAGNPRLTTLLAVLHAVGVRLSVAPADPAPVHG